MIEHEAAETDRGRAERRGLAHNGQAKINSVIDPRAQRKPENQA